MTDKPTEQKWQEFIDATRDVGTTSQQACEACREMAIAAQRVHAWFGEFRLARTTPPDNGIAESANE